ncbi:hypothetical protein A1359_19475 [Methylomonas lenta]|jgi:hypothetical protein|uniref:Uncharacterized protein n=1 Tax=Methylomonas lenta TaxID=980561 RepID=A0A177NT90_9GAMM|nr:hypothetical protein [Methylomonas lenta]MDD2737691.1 hypothetical protein [Methylomonas lenta]OAI21266.1 hypothetical protein A1359_19475 [Methylomonas lenta]
MKTNNEIDTMYSERFAFIETLSREFVAMTGCGVYVYFTPLDIDQLFDKFLSVDLSIRMFARQCVKNLI